jgi:hypothetical protein
MHHSTPGVYGFLICVSMEEEDIMGIDGNKKSMH